jgi:hypothetical protein
MTIDCTRRHDTCHNLNQPILAYVSQTVVTCNVVMYGVVKV